MLEKMIYKNHLNEVFEFGKDGVFVNTNDLRNYSWTTDTNNNRIRAFNRKLVSKKLPIVIVCDSEESGIEARNKIHEIVEKDVIALEYGKIIIGGFYYPCYVTESFKSDYLQTKRCMNLELTVTSDQPYWIRESTSIFRKISEDASGEGEPFLDYPHDYAFDYSSGSAIKMMINTAFLPANFKMIVHGACVDPAVYIGGNAYKVNCELTFGEYLTIDTALKKVYKTLLDGTTINLFKSRDRNHYIFEKIKPGANKVLWDGNFGIDITILEERSEPRWT